MLARISIALPNLRNAWLLPRPVDRRAIAGHNFMSMASSGVAVIQRRGNEYFSKHTELAGIVSVRVHGYTAVDRCVVRRRDCRAGRAGLCRLYHAVPPEPGPHQAAGSEQDSHGPARPGEFAHRRFE